MRGQVSAPARPVGGQVSAPARPGGGEVSAPAQPVEVRSARRPDLWKSGQRAGPTSHHVLIGRARVGVSTDAVGQMPFIAITHVDSSLPLRFIMGLQSIEDPLPIGVQTWPLTRTK